MHYKSETDNVSHWTKHHISWIEKKMNETQGTLGSNLTILVQQMKWLVHTLSEYDKAVDELAQPEKYQKQVNALI